MKKTILSLLLLLTLSVPAYSAPTTLNTSTYDAFGTSHFKDGVVLHIFRQGTSHASDYGKLVAEKFTCADSTCATGTWGTRYTVFEDATTDVRDPVMIEVNGQLWLFFTKYDLSNQTSSGYIVSTDLTGTSWSSYTELYAKEAAIDGFNFHNGAGVFFDQPGTFIIPWAKHDDVGPVWQLIFWKTTDYGATWAQKSVYSGSTKWVEPSIAYIGNNKLIAVARNNAGAALGYTTSSDGGETWSAFVNSSVLGDSSSVKPSMIYYDRAYDNIIVAYLSREATAKFRYSYSEDPLWTFRNDENWKATVDLDSGGYQNGGNGYPIIERVSPTHVLMAWSKQSSSSDADILYEVLEMGISDTDAGIKFS